MRLSDQREQVSPAAVLPQPPPTLPLWAKALYWLVETVATTMLINQFDYGAELQSTGTTDTDPPANTWRRFVMHFEDTVSADTADDQQVSIDILNITSGLPDSTWTDTDYTTAASYIDAIAAVFLQHAAARYHYTRLDAYIMAFRPYTDPKPFALSGAPDWSATKNAIAIGTGSSAPQTSSTVTEVTPSRRHWGRMYSPGLDAGSILASGRLSATTVDGIVNTISARYEDLMQWQLFPVVPTTRVDGVAKRTLQAVTGIKVDDVLDVQRRRRFKHPTHSLEVGVSQAQTKPSDEAESSEP